MSGFFPDMTAAKYHADPCPAPSLSSSIAKIMLDQSPRHAWHAHPRLGLVAEDEEPTRPQQIGTAAHKLILGRGRDIVRIEAPDYRKPEARVQRQIAVAAGKAPILAGDYASVVEMAAAFSEQIGMIEGCEGFAVECGGFGS